MWGVLGVRTAPSRAECLGTHLVRQVVHGQVQLVADQAGRLPRAHHELVELALPEAPLVPARAAAPASAQTATWCDSLGMGVAGLKAAACQVRRGDGPVIC